MLELFKNSIFRKLAVVCSSVGQGLMIGFWLELNLHCPVPEWYSLLVLMWCHGTQYFSFFRLKKIMIRSQNGDARQSQWRKMNTDRKDKWWLCHLNKLTHLLKVCPPAHSWFFILIFLPLIGGIFVLWLCCCWYLYCDCAAVDICTVTVLLLIFVLWLCCCWYLYCDCAAVDICTVIVLLLIFVLWLCCCWYLYCDCAAVDTCTVIVLLLVF